MAKEKEFRNLQKITPEIASTYPSAPTAELTPIYKNITFQDITATTQNGRRAGLIWGLPEAPVSDINFKNVNITADNSFGVFFGNNIRFDNCQLITRDGKNKLAVTNAEVSIDGKK
jgi:hypothetical protein